MNVKDRFLGALVTEIRRYVPLRRTRCLLLCMLFLPFLKFVFVLSCEIVSYATKTFARFNSVTVAEFEQSLRFRWLVGSIRKRTKRELRLI